MTDAMTTKEANFEQENPTPTTNINGFNEKNRQQMVTKTGRLNGFSKVENGGIDVNVITKNEMSDLVEILCKLNPMVEEFVSPSLANHHHCRKEHDQHQNQGNHFLENGFGYSTDNFVLHSNSGNANGYTNRRKIDHYNQGKRRLNNRKSIAQREDSIRKTVYVSDINLQVTKELLADLFLSCGPVVDCRICGDPNSVLGFAFVEFYKEEDARASLNLSGTMLGYYPLKVLPSKTAIAPFTQASREVILVLFVQFIQITQADIKLFLGSVCGEVKRLRLLGDYHHSTRIGFVEFEMAESAIAILNCSGAVLGSLPIRVSPSKTPDRPCTLYPAMM
ncbi:Polyadenylate-binding protein-interacting protein 10 [Hibiscus syriacus]|uniref:Polyadenylate-binding protein-interacting protein 10 n=1 Tax=Hibiscus syriacus TaxID=106335 RepID=A0A6A2YM39_HIBSY|nr:Polyadenylate-binding protein-interacting protein 10 [Hibiscus syriacus]